MARKKKHPAHENHERWLVSYADFITLLFAFFVVMFASSQTDKGRAKEVSEAVAKALEEGGVTATAAAVAKVLGGTVDDKGQGNAQMKGPGGAVKAPKEPPPEQVVELMPSLKLLSKELEAEIAEGKLEMHLEPRGLVVSLREAAFFPSGSEAVTAGGLPILDKVANALNTIPNPVRIEGHTDSRPIHTDRFHNNWELSSARAVAMLEVLTTKYAMRADRFGVTGYADTVPVDSNDTDAGRARNRRVDIVIQSQLSLQANPRKPGQEKAAKPASQGH